VQRVQAVPNEVDGEFSTRVLSHKPDPLSRGKHYPVKKRCYNSDASSGLTGISDGCVREARGRMMLVRAAQMNVKLDNAFSRSTFAVAAFVCVVFSLSTTAVIAAQTKDHPQFPKAPLGQISARVSRSDTDEPIPKAQVQLSPADPETSKVPGPEHRAHRSRRHVFIP
jgi:hypothetical protein